MKINNQSKKPKAYTPYAPLTPPIPTKPTDWSAELVTYPCFVQPKLNGVRAMIAPDGRVYLKSGEVREHLNYQYGAYGVWLDVELWKKEYDIHKIIGLVNRQEPDNETRQLEAWVVDLIEPNMRQSDRVAVLKPFSALTGTLCLTPIHLCEDSFQAIKLFKAYMEEYPSNIIDGIIYRSPATYYQFGKTGQVLKRKRELDAEFECTGVTEGMGKFFGMLGSFQLVDHVGRTFSCGGGDLTVADRQSMWKNPPIGQMLQIRFPYYSAEGIPQCPQFVRVRNNPAL